MTVIKQAGQEIVTRNFINHKVIYQKHRAVYLYGLSVFSMEFQVKILSTDLL